MRKQQKEMFLHKYGYLIAFAAVFLATVLFVLIVANDRSRIRYPALGITAFTLAFSVGGAILLLDKFIFPLIEKRSIKKYMKSASSSRDENEVCFSDQGIEISSELVSVDFKWEALFKALETDSDFIFYTSEYTSLFIPKRAFLSETDANFLRCLARAKLSDKARF